MVPFHIGVSAKKTAPFEGTINEDQNRIGSTSWPPSCGNFQNPHTIRSSLFERPSKTERGTVTLRKTLDPKSCCRQPSTTINTPRGNELCAGKTWGSKTWSPKSGNLSSYRLHVLGVFKIELIVS